MGTGTPNVLLGESNLRVKREDAESEDSSSTTREQRLTIVLLRSTSSPERTGGKLPARFEHGKTERHLPVQGRMHVVFSTVVSIDLFGNRATNPIFCRGMYVCYALQTCLQIATLDL